MAEKLGRGSSFLGGGGPTKLDNASQGRRSKRGQPWNPKIPPRISGSFLPHPSNGCGPTSDRYWVSAYKAARQTICENLAGLTEPLNLAVTMRARLSNMDDLMPQACERCWTRKQKASSSPMNCNTTHNSWPLVNCAFKDLYRLTRCCSVIAPSPLVNNVDPPRPIVSRDYMELY